MLHRWTQWRLERSKLASPVEQFIVELIFKLGRKRHIFSKEKFKYGIDATEVFRDRKSPIYILRPAVYRTLHGESLDAEFASKVSRSGKK